MGYTPWHEYPMACIYQWYNWHSPGPRGQVAEHGTNPKRAMRHFCLSILYIWFPAIFCTFSHFVWRVFACSAATALANVCFPFDRDKAKHSAGNKDIDDSIPLHGRARVQNRASGAIMNNRRLKEFINISWSWMKFFLRSDFFLHLLYLGRLVHLFTSTVEALFYFVILLSS